MTLSDTDTAQLWETFRAGGGAELVRDAVRLVLQELIEAEATEAIGAGRYERSDARVNEDERWYRVLNLSEIAMLLIALSLSDEFCLPDADVRPLYGISPDTARRGLAGLVGHGLLTAQNHHALTPMTAVGYTTDKGYTLQHPFAPERKAQPGRTPQPG